MGKIQLAYRSHNIYMTLPNGLVTTKARNNMAGRISLHQAFK